MRALTVGVIVLMSAALSFADEPDAKPRKTLKVFSNNVGIFPQRIVAFFPGKVKEKKTLVIADEEVRAALLAKGLLEFAGDPDVVQLQEIWSIKARDRLIQDLSEKYPYYKHPAVIGSGPAAMQASGLIVFSKFPIEDFAYKEFTRGIGVDKLARKGIIGARLNKDGRTIAVFSTHMQAGGRKDSSVKPDQLHECNEFIREFAGKHPETVIVMVGDFNIRSTEPEAYDAIFKHLEGARDSYQEQPGSPTTTTRNEDQPTKRIDYLLTFGDVHATSTIVDPAGPRVSDHLAIFGTVDLD